LTVSVVFEIVSTLTTVDEITRNVTNGEDTLTIDIENDHMIADTIGLVIIHQNLNIIGMNRLNKIDVEGLRKIIIEDKLCSSKRKGRT
jgi:hypothetical protein